MLMTRGLVCDSCSTVALVTYSSRRNDRLLCVSRRRGFVRVEEGRTITAFEAPFLGDVVRHIIKEKKKKRSGKLYTASSVLLLLR